MRKIINGKKYDTETAEYIGEWLNGYGVTDFQYTKETLYRKKNGEFFIYCEGGPLSAYAEYRSTLRVSGEDIVPLTEDDARTWSECHLNCDDYEDIFGEVAE